MKNGVSRVVLAGVMLVPFAYIGIIYTDVAVNSPLRSRAVFDGMTALCDSPIFLEMHKPGFWLGEKVFYPWRNWAYYFPVIIGLKYGLAWLVNSMALAGVGVSVMFLVRSLGQGRQTEGDRPERS